MKIIFGFGFIAFYIGWVVYHAFIKHDIKKHRTDLYALTTLITVWVIIYAFLFS